MGFETIESIPLSRVGLSIEQRQERCSNRRCRRKSRTEILPGKRCLSLLRGAMHKPQWVASRSDGKDSDLAIHWIASSLAR